jgi:hypothetical protein
MAEQHSAQPGESWAYRARGVDDLVEVVVVRFGTQHPALGAAVTVKGAMGGPSRSRRRACRIQTSA